VKLTTGLLAGAAAGAAGTTALNTATYLDMVLRGRPASSTPDQTIEKLAGLSHLTIPGDEDTRGNRVGGLGALTGILAGVGVGVALGAARAAGWRPGLLSGSVVAGTGALLAGNGPMTVLGVTDPRSWSATDWISDLVPHLAYGAVAGAVLHRLTSP
jgi:pheromone shutdown protein TraB